MSHLHGGIEGGLLDEQGCVDDGYLVIEVGSTSHQRKRGLATHQSYLDVDSVDQEFILQKHIHVVKRHRHFAVFEWHASTHVVSYIHLDRVEVRAQQRYVVNVSETIGHPVTVTSANRKGSQQRRESITHYTRLHDVRVDV